MAIRAASLIVDVDADVKAAQSKIQGVDKDLKNLAKSDHELKVDADTAQAERSVQELDKMIVRIAGQNVEVSVDADLNPALAELARAEQQAKELDNLNPSIEVDADTQEAEAGLRRLSTEMRDLDGLQGKVAQSAGGFAAGLGGIAKTALGVAGGIGLATAGSRLLGDAFGFVTDSMFGTNIAMENVEARLMAFTKDGAETQRILAEIRTEAAETPFAFNEMADAVASLLPPAKQANLDLMDLVETAEILAASNPLEGLEGAAFALREALSGDFQSLIERFNIPRTEINRLKEEGLPNIEIVRQAMQSLGLDITLVGNLAQTTSGKWSTFQDNIRNALAAIGEPFMDKINSGLTDLVAFTETEQFTAMMERWADKAVTVADKVGDIGAAMADMPNQDWFKAFQSMASGNDVDAGAWGEFAGFMNDVADAFNWVGTSGARAHNAIAGIGDDASGAAGGAWELSDAQKAVQEATKGVEDAVTRSGGAKQRDHQATQALAEANAYLGNTYRDAAGWVASYYAGVGYGNDVLLYQTDIAIQLNNALSTLSTTQGNLNDVMGVFASQGSEYQSTQQSLTDAYDILQRKQSEGIALSESEQLLLDRYPDLYGRLQGAQEDAAVQEGLVAAAKTEVMLAQDELNAAIARGEKDLGPYNERLSNATALLSDVDPQSGAQLAIENLTTAINQNLVTAINDLITKMGELDGTTANPKVTLDTTAFDLGVGQSKQGLTEFDQAQAEPTADLDNDPFNSKIEDARIQLNDFDGRRATATIEAHFVSTGDPLAMQAYGYHSGGTVVGITQAEGGFHDKPTVALIGEDGPELVLPLSKPARMHQLLSQAGIVPMAEGGIVGRRLAGNTGGVAAGQPVDTVSISGDGGSLYKDFLDRLIADLDAASQRFDDDDIARLKDYASAAREGVHLIDDTLNLLTALSETTVSYTPQIESGVSQLKFMSEHVTESVGDSAAMFDKDFIEHAKLYASAGSEAVGLIGDTLSLYNDFGETVVDYSPTVAANISALKFMAEHAVRSIADSAAMFDENGLAAAKLFADTAAPIVNLLKNGVDGFNALGDFVAPAEENVNWFLNWLLYIVDELEGNSTSRFSEEGLAAASRFAKTAGDIVSILRNGVDGFRALRDFRAPAEEDVNQFINWTDYFVDELVGTVTAKYEKEGLEQASRFSKAAGDVLGLIGAASNMSELQRFIAPNQKALDAYFGFLDDTTDRIVTEAAKFEKEGLDGAQHFTETAGDVLALLIQSSDFSGLKRYRGGLLDGIDDYLGDVKTAVQMIAEMGDELGDGLIDAEAVAMKINTIVDLLTSGRDSMSIAQRNAVSGQYIRNPGGSSGGSSSGFNAADVRNGTVRIGNTINLTMTDGSVVGQWYADQQYRDEQLAPVGIGG